MAQEIEFDTALKHPFTCIVAGPTKAGKTELVKKLVKHADTLISPSPQSIYWCYSENQPGYAELDTLVRFHEGMPPVAELKADTSQPKLVVLDDLMSDLKDSKSLTELFVRGCHHWNISCIHIVQNLFYGGRTSRVNAGYIFLLKNPSDRLQASNLAHQLYPKRQSYFMEALEDATQQPHSYLLVDLNQSTPEILRLRTSVFPGENTVVYAPKSL